MYVPTRPRDASSSGGGMGEMPSLGAERSVVAVAVSCLGGRGCSRGMMGVLVDLEAGGE